jgi:L-threonylcarbamoyladenylate synthase
VTFSVFPDAASAPKFPSTALSSAYCPITGSFAFCLPSANMILRNHVEIPAASDTTFDGLVGIEMAETTIINVNSEHPEAASMARAAAVLSQGGLVAFPTETVYGLGADALNARAVRRIFRAKGRPSDNPLIVHISSLEMLGSIAEQIPPQMHRLADRFWPGPLTFVLSRRPEVAQWVSAGLPTVAVRMPRNQIALDLIRLSGTPIAAPSANVSGRPSPTRAHDVLADLDGKIDLILDGGSTRVGIESTVLDLTATPPAILRPGWVTRDQIESVIGPISPAASGEELKRSPGTRHRHYSPRAQVVLAESASAAELVRLCQSFQERGKVGLVGHTSLDLNGQPIEQVLVENHPDAYAASIYSAFRDLDAAGVAVIIVEVDPDKIGQSDAIMDRLRRAASETIPGGQTI